MHRNSVSHSKNNNTIIADIKLGYSGHTGKLGFQLKVNLTLPGHGITGLFGHSGSGKTTLLRCIAGLEHTNTGYLEVNGEVWQDSERRHFIPTHQRALGYVFQEASLFPHLSVQENLHYAIKRCSTSNSDWNTTIDMLGIAELMQRMPARLSGGERQRVAIARALLTKPRLLLMDEPLSALDAARKQEILPYLERLHDELAVPILYVSHQSDEIARLADHVVLMENGHTLASGPLLTLLTRMDLPTALAEDAGAVIETTVTQHDQRYHLMQLDFSGGAIVVPHRDIAIGKKLRLRLHARDVIVELRNTDDATSFDTTHNHNSKHGVSSLQNRIAATIVSMADAAHPAHIMLQLDACGTLLLARITRRACDQLALTPGKHVWALIKSVALLA